MLRTYQPPCNSIILKNIWCLLSNAFRLVLQRIGCWKVRRAWSSESLYLLIVTPLVHFIAPGREISRPFGLYAAAAVLAPDSKLALGLSQIRKPSFVAGRRMCEAKVLDWLATFLAAVRARVMWQHTCGLQRNVTVWLQWLDWLILWRMDGLTFRHRASSI